MRRPLLLAIVLAVLPLVAGCNNNSTEPNRTLSYTGALTKTNDHVDGTLDMHSTGNARASLVSLTQTAADGTPVVPPTAGIALAIGPDRTPCIPTGSFLFATQGHISLGLDKGSWCLRFVPTATLADGVTLNFEVHVEVTD